MPGRLEFETEYFNEAEEAVQHMQFEPGDGINPRTGEMEPEMELKMSVMDIYSSRLTARVERKKILFEHRLLEYKKNAAAEKKRTKEERDLYNKAKPFARMMKHEDFEDFTAGLAYEANLRQAIGQLQDWRQMQISDLRAGEKYEIEKHARLSRTAAVNPFDRLASSRINKPTPPIDTPTGTSLLTAPELQIRNRTGLSTPPNSVSPVDRALVNGASNGVLTPAHPNKQDFVCQPVAGIPSLRMNDENAAGWHLISPAEQKLCSVLRIQPKPYLVMKEAVLDRAVREGGALRKQVVKDVCKVNGKKVERLYEFWVSSGWIDKA